jgi:hypothetical protein
MILKINFSKIIHSVLKREPSHYDKRTMHPAREWLFGLLAFSVIVGVGGVISLQTLSQYQNLKIDAGTFEEKVPSYNAVLIEKVINMYRLRQDTFNNLRETSNQFAEEYRQFEKALSSATSSATSTDSTESSKLIPVAN